MYKFSQLFSVLSAVGLLASTPLTQAKNLTIGLASEPLAIDPHYNDVTTNTSISMHVFDPLFTFDAAMKLRPVLAKSWGLAGDDTTWKIELRDDVKFSNGDPFTAKDVVYTFCRVMNNETAASKANERIISLIDRIDIPDPYTLIIKTKLPFPNFINELERIQIIWSGLAKVDQIAYDLSSRCGGITSWPSVNDFNQGTAMIGTGPYVLRRFTKGDAIEFSRNVNYWGLAPEWDDVKYQSVPSIGPRLTGFLAGNYDVIENPAPRDADRIKKAGHHYVSIPSLRLIFLQLDVGRSPSPHVISPKGANDNPLQDVRVRQALSLAIDRHAIVDKIMGGAAAPAYQFLPDGLFGTIEQPIPLAYNPDQAKKLLEQAGYPNGFKLTIHGTNDRYINDAQILQSIAQYFTRIGVDTSVQAVTRTVFFPQRFNREYSVAMGAWVASSGETSSFLSPWVAHLNQDLGYGTANYGGYENAEFNQLFTQAMVTMDDGKRASLLQEAQQIVLKELPFLPLHFENASWAARKGLQIEGRVDQRTLPWSVRSE